MINYSLPKELTVCGNIYPIRYQWTAALDILSSYSDPDLTDYDKAIITLRILYRDSIPDDTQEALDKAVWFIDGGKERVEEKNRPRLMDWEQDFPFIISEINHVAGREIRGDTDMHWWTFLSYYQAMGDCAFANIVAIRKKLKQGRKLEKYERDYYRENREIIDLKTRYSEKDSEIIKAFLGEKAGGK